ncbi:GPW/gp25 family protein [Pararhodobacter sp. SW119]|uniref:GPW/gp25 family protein n=1 Tax=Pararhodobacter sp. SW119 TaxID=2780075 RepID=UPI001AE0A2E8|nr:GPW/gp25 family protein [Pararhodobacter sp. SW119]
MTLSAGRHLAFPFRIDGDGRTAAPRNDSDHVRDEILQLLLTNPGERLFLPGFGGGVRRLVFEPTSDVLKGVTKARITEALKRWLGHRAAIEALEVVFEGETVDVLVKFRPAGSPDSRVLRFQRKGR